MLRHGGLWQETTPSWLGELPCSKKCSCEGKTPAVRMGKGSGVVRQQKGFSDCSESTPKPVHTVPQKQTPPASSAGRGGLCERCRGSAPSERGANREPEPARTLGHVSRAEAELCAPLSTKQDQSFTPS